MKLVIVVETPEDDALHWPRIERALLAYCRQVRHNNEAGWDERDVTDLGCTGGPNVLKVAPDTTITEVRVDRARLLFAIWGWLPWWLRWSVAWALPA